MGVPSVPFHPLATRMSDIEPRRRSWSGSNERNDSSGEARRGGNAMASPSAAELAARLDRLPMTRHIWVLVTLISLGGGFELYDLFLTAYIAPGLVKTNFFTPEPLGLFSMLAQHGVAGVGTFVFTLLPGCLSA